MFSSKIANTQVLGISLNGVISVFAGKVKELLINEVIWPVGWLMGVATSEHPEYAPLPSAVHIFCRAS